MRRILTTAVLSAACVAALNGCGGKKDAAEKALPEVTLTESSGSGEAEEAAAEEEAAEEPQESSGVRRSYGYFVKRGDEVYFRMPGEKDMTEAAVFGEYSDIAAMEDGKLMAYDTAADVLSEAADGKGFGKIAITNENIYLSSNMEEPVRIISADGTEKDSIPGFVDAADPEGNYAALRRWNDKNYAISVLKGDEIIAETEPGEYSEICGIGEGYLFYDKTDLDSYKTELWSYEFESGEAVCLGEYPDDEDHIKNSELEQFLIEDGIVYLAKAAYEGTGHFYAGGSIFRAEAGKENSLEIAAEQQTAKEVSQRFVVKNGEVILTEAEPDGAGMDWEENCLFVVNEAGERHDVPGIQIHGENSRGSRINIEIAEYVDGDIFAIRNTEQREPDADIGWREAYIRERTEFLRIDPVSGTESLIAEVINPVIYIGDDGSEGGSASYGDADIFGLDPFLPGEYLLPGENGEDFIFRLSAYTGVDWYVGDPDTWNEVGTAEILIRDQKGREVVIADDVRIFNTTEAYCLVGEGGTGDSWGEICITSYEDILIYRAPDSMEWEEMKLQGEPYVS